LEIVSKIKRLSWIYLKISFPSTKKSENSQKKKEIPYQHASGKNCFQFHFFEDGQQLPLQFGDSKNL
jgi:hypothetical protein